MNVTISKVLNGYVLTSQEATVVVEKVPSNGSTDALVGMVWNLFEMLGENMDGFAEKQVALKIVHGDEYDCKKKNCKICGGK